MIRIDYINEDNVKVMKEIVNKERNDLLDEYIEHLNSMLERNKEDLDKSIFVYEDDVLVLYLSFVVVNHALFLTTKYQTDRIKSKKDIYEYILEEFKDYDVINLEF